MFYHSPSLCSPSSLPESRIECLFPWCISVCTFQLLLVSYLLLYVFSSSCIPVFCSPDFWFLLVLVCWSLSWSCITLPLCVLIIVFISVFVILDSPGFDLLLCSRWPWFWIPPLFDYWYSDPCLFLTTCLPAVFIKFTFSPHHWLHPDPFPFTPHSQL